MGRKVKLHGGPLHGQTVELPDDRDHIHILQPNLDWLRAYQEGDGEEPPGLLPVKEGIYSQVYREPGDFEWDGFISHD